MSSKTPLKNYFGLAQNYEPISSKRGRTRKLTPKAIAAADAKLHKTKTKSKSKAKSNSKKNNISDKLNKSSDKFLGLPMYLIHGHACICPRKGPCMKKEVPFSFKVPEKTYLISFAQAGEFSCFPVFDIINREIPIRSYMYLHSEADLFSEKEVGKTKFGFFSGVRRAIGGHTEDGYETEYPNIIFGFNEYKKDNKGKKVLVNPSENEFGVFNMDDINSETNYKTNNTFSIIKQDAKKEDWLLDEIIKEVYEKDKITSAIFIIGGCLSSCVNVDKTENKEKYKTVVDDLTAAGKLMDTANAYYPTMEDTFTQKEIVEYGKNIIHGAINTGTYGIPVFPQLSEVKHLFEENLYDPKEISKLKQLFHTENRGNIEQLMGKKFK